MKRVLTGLLCLGLAGPAFAQDDWEYQEDPAQNLYVAVSRYDGGRALIAQCRNGELKLAIAGLPGAGEGRRTVHATRADGRVDQQVWESAPGGVVTSTVPGRDVRFLRGGGDFGFRSTRGDGAPLRASFDLPSQYANLDRVLIACGRDPDDERDLLARTPEAVVLAPARGERSGPARREANERVTSSVELSCIVRSLRLTECRPEQELPLGSGVGQERAEAYNDKALTGAAAAEMEGRVYYAQLTTVESITVERVN